MNYYYCKSEHEHAVICTRSPGRAKTVFLDMVNENLEESKQLTTKDVTVILVNVYLDEEENENI